MYRPEAPSALWAVRIFLGVPPRSSFGSVGGKYFLKCTARKLPRLCGRYEWMRAVFYLFGLLRCVPASEKALFYEFPGVLAVFAAGREDYKGALAGVVADEFDAGLRKEGGTGDVDGIAVVDFAKGVAVV